ncbi:V-type ATP synthase subunit D [Thiocapsa marina]|uniref:H+transporting two-sector ATPase D subunit n=1 Tax=Thiocapsa marina 5811 TaxID=768671 RepID=F9UIF4_9GAMM|nr:V-type ATP synthase subunit D [Thiocapsa marina]EGV16042.1 H+transporting two-sector ATPase D subunit [Thiocapsa marina 5811]
MTERAIVPTHSAFLELKEERSGMREGYRFLDEKRLILAAEILAELGRYEREMNAFQADYREAVDALQGAVARHGLEGLAVHPPAPPLDTDCRLTPRRVLGVTLHDLVDNALQQQSPAPSVSDSPEADGARRAFQALIPRIARLAAMVGNLQRLRADYARTARRARALEDVLLPEINDTLQAVESALEELEREEVVRARQVRI